MKQITPSCNCNCNTCEHCSTATPVVRIQIAGNAFVLTSTLMLETLKMLEKRDNKALCLTEHCKDEEKEIFRISTGKIASISKYGITFAEANKAGYATATVLFPEKVKDKKQFIKENFANTIFMLNELENRAKNACKNLERAYAELDKLIEEI